MLARSLYRWLVPVFVLAAAVRCGGGDSLTLPPEGLPAAIEQLSGDGQNGIVGRRLTDTLIVRLTDSRDRPVLSQPVEFRLIAGGTGADLIPDTALTNADGQARSVWVLGHIAGQQRVEARVLATGAAGGLKATFSATAAADQPDTVFAVKGDGQTGSVGTALADSLAVVVADQFGNSVAGETVNWSVPAGQGSVSAAGGITGSDGRTAVLRTLGPNTGAQTATATAAKLPAIPVVFSHTATAGGAVRIVKISPDNLVAPAGFKLTDSVVVQVQDANGNGVPGRSVNWVASSGGSASPTSSVTDATGRAFTVWTLSPVAGGNTLTVAMAGLPQIHFSATGTAATPTRIQAQTDTTPSGTAGQAVSPAPSVKVTDQNGNPVQGVKVDFQVTQGGGQVMDQTGGGSIVSIATDPAGLAILTAWVLGPTAGSNTVTASASGTGGPLTGSPVTFTAVGAAGPATQLAFVQQPGATVAGSSITPAVSVVVQDANGNTVTGSTAQVTIAIGANPGGGTLSGTPTAAASGGIATFPGLSINRAGQGYTLTASGTNLAGATSTAFDIVVGPATQLGFVLQPSNTAANQPIAPPVQVAVQDAQGNTVTGSTAVIAVALGPNLQGATLGGTLSRQAVAGIASFDDLTVDKTGTGYVLLASDPAATLTGATSAAFDISSGQAAKLAFQVGPTTTAAGAPISPAVQVVILDAANNPVTTATDSVVISLGTNPGGSTLSGTLRRAAVNGVAVFADLSLNRTGTGYTLVAANPAGALTGATSGAFDITLGAGRRLAFQVQPSNVAAGAVITPAVQVRSEDLLGNLDGAFTGTVTLALSPNPGGATLGGTPGRAAVAGVATFDDLTLDRTGTGYTLTASATGNTGATSAAFNVTPGPAAQLVFTTQPGHTIAGSPITPAPAVTVRDALGNTVVAPAIQLTIAIGTNPAGGTLSGTTSQNTVNGVATFPGLSIDKTGIGYTLQVSGGSVPNAVSAPFNILTGTGPSTATTITADTPDPSVVGQPYTVSYSVTSSGGAPSGSVSVSDGTDQCTGSVSTGSCTLTSTTSGAKQLVATFVDPSGNFQGSVSSAVAHTVSLGGTTLTLSDTPDPTVVGEPITASWTLSVAPPAAGTPSGTVTVTAANGTESCAAPVAAGSCQIILLSRSGSNRTLTATYAGDANFSSSQDSDNHGVNRAATTTTIGPATPGTAEFGQPVSVGFSVTPVPPGGGTPTGTVTVTSDLGGNCSAAANVGSCTLTPAVSGVHTLTASFAQDGSYTASASTGLSLTVNPAATTTTIVSDNPDPSVIGQPVTVSVQVAAQFAAPTGSVTVDDGAGATCTIQTLSGGAGSCNLTPLVAGNPTLTASYTPATGDFLSSSGNASHTVDRFGPASPLTTSATVPGGVVGQVTVITVQLRDAFGNIITIGGAGTVAGDVTSGPNAGTTLTVQDNGDGTFTLTYIPAASGTDDITITLNGIGISGSPYQSVIP